MTEVPDDVVVILRNSIRQPLVAPELLDVLNHVQLEALAGKGSSLMLSSRNILSERCQSA